MLRFSCIYFYLFYVSDIAKGADVNVEAHLQIDPYFMKRMENSLRMQSVLLRSDNSINEEIPEIKPKSDEHIMEMLNPQFSRKTEDKIKTHEERLQKKGVESIESVAEYLQTTLNYTVDKSFVNDICELFVTKLKSYFNFVANKKTYNDVDKDNTVFDKIDMAQTLQNSLERTLINEIIANNSNISKDDKYIVTEAVYIFSLRNKQFEMEYICKTMGICRPFPGFSDYFAKILSEVLKLFDIKFEYLIIKSAQLLISKRSFLETVLRDEILEYLKEKATNIVDTNMTEMREGISVLRSVIIHRHRVVNINDEAIKGKTKAMRIILDIVDTVFDKIGIDALQMKAETVISAIQDWADNLVIDIEPTLNTFITDSVASLKFGLNPVAKTEIRTLADIVYFGKPVGSKYAADYLLTKGSKFVNGLDSEKSGLGDFRLKINKNIKQMLV